MEPLIRRCTGRRVAGGFSLRYIDMPAGNGPQSTWSYEVIGIPVAHTALLPRVVLVHVDGQFDWYLRTCFNFDGACTILAEGVADSREAAEAEALKAANTGELRGMLQRTDLGKMEW